jgi:hypothetical protein
MARLRVADGGDGLQICRVAVNLLNKKSRTADKRRSFKFEVGRGLNFLTVKKETAFYEMLHRASDLSMELVSSLIN